ncbi:MAG: hypothetical protein KF791_12915 [Verrucomicrobiae bacterium]|nr:hypothetical protein [Verrucomicrobiae bacterium]
MKDPMETSPSTPEIPAELDSLRLQVAELRGTVRLVLLGLILTTGGLCLFLYRQTKLLRHQVLVQQAAVVRTEAAIAPALGLIPKFQQVAWKHPDYASNVLANFGLRALAPDGPASDTAPTLTP